QPEQSTPADTSAGHASSSSVPAAVPPPPSPPLPKSSKGGSGLLLVTKSPFLASPKTTLPSKVSGGGKLPFETLPKSKLPNFPNKSQLPFGTMTKASPPRGTKQ